MTFITKVNDQVEIEWDRLVININTGKYIYEIDLEQDTLEFWTRHIETKKWCNKDILQGISDIYSLIKYIQPMVKKVDVTDVI